MKVVYLGNFHDPFCTEAYVARAFERLGHAVQRVSVRGATLDDIVWLTRETEPHLLIFAKGQFRGADGPWPAAANEVVRMIYQCRPHVGKVACWHWDLVCPEFSQSRWGWSKIIADAVDVMALTDGYSADMLDGHHEAKVTVIRDGVPDDVDESAGWPTEYAGDVLFLGSAYGDRPKLLRALRDKFGSRFRHVAGGVRGPALTKLIRSHKIIVGPHDPHFPRYWSDRLSLVTAHGGLYAGPTISGMSRDGWVAGENYIATADSVPGIIDCLGVALGRDAKALRRIRMAGYRHAKENCTWERRVGELLTALRMDSE